MIAAPTTDVTMIKAIANFGETTYSAPTQTLEIE